MESSCGILLKSIKLSALRRGPDSGERCIRGGSLLLRCNLIGINLTRKKIEFERRCILINLKYHSNGKTFDDEN